jgi:phosphoribosylformylglycinamidine (FGAM) synthase-like amidotransferase family enzyme
MGLMPHPERVSDVLNHPSYTRGGGRACGLVVFESAMKYLAAGRMVEV